MPPRYVADLSLALINRTGAYHVCHDLVRGLPEFFSATRYWRLYRSREPRGLLRRLFGKAMLFELSHTGVTERLPVWDRHRGARPRTLFLDPLYVLHASLDSNDIVLCHDIGPVSMPELYDAETCTLYRKAYARIRESRPGMVFVSEASRTDFIARFGDDFPFLEAIPLYVRPGSNHGQMTKPAAIEGPFLLTVAALETRKNYLRTIEAYAASGLRERGFSYVFCGPRANQTEAVEELARRTPGVIWLGFVTDAELRWIYRHASGFVLPSLLEGFGLPALEAAQHGLLSVISHDGALAEAVGGAAITVDPKAPADIARGMREIIEMPPAEREARLAVAQRHAAELTYARYIARWSRLLASA